MKRTINHAAAIALLVGFAALALGSGSSPSSGGGGYSGGGGGSSGSSYVTYTFVNNSSQDVFVSDMHHQGQKLLRKGDSMSVSGEPGCSTSSFSYSPQALVSVSQSGNTFTFSNAF